MGSSVTIYTGIIWAAVILYVCATVANAIGVIFEKSAAEKTGYRLAYLGLLLHSVNILYWWSIVGHGPYMAPSEVLMSDAWVVMVSYLCMAKLYPKIRPASIIAFPATFLLLALAVFFNPGVRTLPATFRSIWLVLHIGFYKISLATLIIAFAFSLFYLVKRGEGPGWIGRLPERPVLDVYSYRFAGFGVIFWTIGMLAGSIWAYQSWGRYWGWDPVETWSLITWILFGIYLHLRRFFRLAGVKAAWFFIFCFAVSLITLFVTSHISTSIHAEYFK